MVLHYGNGKTQEWILLKEGENSLSRARCKGRKKTVATCDNLTLSQIRHCVNYVTFVIVCYFIPVNFRLRFIFLFFCLSVDETKTAEQSPVKPKGRYICEEKIAFVMCSFYLPY